MRILHTADWHLGKRLEQCERTDEHQEFLNWLIETLDRELIDVLVVAGDIFDTGNPSNSAIKLYYDFLWKASMTCCNEIIIIGGNHDSVSMLNAPKELLGIFNIHVIGGVPENFGDQIILVKNKEGAPALIVCAVPFLRDKDVRISVAGETATDLESRLKQGIRDHYHKFKELVAAYKLNGIPVIATGHLFTAGSTASENQSDIHVGNLGKIDGNQFPKEFDYIALGHLHKPQVVNQMNHIQYSGSPIPLSFSEASDRKVVKVINFEEGKLKELNSIEIPTARKLIRIKGDLKSVKTKLETLQDQHFKFPTWVEVQLETESMLPDLYEQLTGLIKDKPFIGQLFTRQHSLRKLSNLDSEVEEALDLSGLDLKSVFKKKLEAAFGDADTTEIVKTFLEAIELSESISN